MKKLLTNAFVALTIIASNAQEINFVEFDLDNGLHVILHQDNRAPVITTSVLYHVGSKDEEEGRTGFAHFFEHLLFEFLQIIGVQKSEQIQFFLPLHLLNQHDIALMW